MKVDFGANPYLFPQPVLMVATYGENDCVDVMAVAWGGICAHNMIALNVSSNRKTVVNIRKRGAFTVSVADIEHLKESDYLGTVSGNSVNIQRSSSNPQFVGSNPRCFSAISASYLMASISCFPVPFGLRKFTIGAPKTL
jgi:flavin reductase (DIM6/NTAB) family NADH-FMN oxidoreductase RutF